MFCNISPGILRPRIKDTRPTQNFRCRVGSRGWWEIANTLLTNVGCTENIPALHHPDSSWAMDPEEKATELAKTFRSKAQLPPTVANACSLLPEYSSGAQPTGFLRIRIRSAFKFLRDLDEQVRICCQRESSRSAPAYSLCLSHYLPGNYSTSPAGRCAGVRIGRTLCTNASRVLLLGTTEAYT